MAGSRGSRRWRGASLVLAVVLAACTPAEPSTIEPLIPGNRRTYGALTVDIDGDGDEDVLLNLHGYPGSGLYLNDGSGGLTDSGAVFQPHPGAPIEPDRHDCDVADVDRSGRLDIFCVTGGEVGAKDFPWQTNELLLQQTDGTFVERSDVWGVTEPYTRGRDVAFVNADGDAWPDLVTTADRRTDSQRSETIVYLDGNGTRFLDQGPAGLPRFGPVRCLEPADWNRDGYTDLALCPMKGGVRLFEATGQGRFVEVTAARAAGPTDTESWAVQFADLDGDGFDDMVRSNTTTVTVRRWDPTTGRFVAGQSIAQPDARSLALARYDGDAKLDLYVMNRGCSSCAPPSNASDRIYRGRGDGTFGLRETIDSPGSGSFVVAWAPSVGSRARWIVGNGDGPASGPVEVVASG